MLHVFLKLGPLRYKLRTNKLKIIKNLVSNQCSIFDSPRFSSDCGSSPVKTYANKQILYCWKKYSCAQWARTSNLRIIDFSLSKLSYVGRYAEWNLNWYHFSFIVPCLYFSIQFPITTVKKKCSNWANHMRGDIKVVYQLV